MLMMGDYYDYSKYSGCDGDYYDCGGDCDYDYDYDWYYVSNV